VYVKLFGTILDSSIWATDLATRVVWITMLAMADEFGIVSASVGGLARRACVSEKECAKALKNLLSPDPDSRTKEHDGRRIEPLEGGWRLLNYAKYRELRTRKQMADAMRQTRHRHSKRDTSRQPVTSHDVTTEAEAEAYAEAEAEEKSKALVALKRDDADLPDHHETKSHGNGGYPKRGAVSVAVIIAGLQDVEVATARRQTKEAFRQMMVEIVFSYWAKRLGHERALLDGTRRQLLAKRFVENGDNLSELLYVVDGALRDDWTMGRDPKSRRAYDDVETIFRDRAQVERFAGTVPGYKQGTPHPMAEKYGAPA
jgi:hypothetical protein